MAKNTESTKAANLPCEKCGHENEAERVYCHNCGTKLDRSLLPQDNDKTKKDESPEAAQKRIKKITNPSGGAVLNDIKTAVSVLLYAALAAVVLLIIQKPEDAPEPSTALLERSVGGDLMDAIDSPQPRRVDFTEAEINGHLQQILKSKGGGGLLEFKRAYVNFQPSAVHFGSEQELFGLPVYSGVRYRVEQQGGKLTATLIGGSFGCLAVHPAAMPYLDFFFQKLWTALAREKKQMENMQDIIVRKGAVTLVTKGGAAP
ncbi:MAG: zinc ribbon domain-containing protein [Chthoniobacter sp.]|nr:zinc ribbon domain-containing protein [Chthoniobacter sp.]